MAWSKGSEGTQHSILKSSNGLTHVHKLLLLLLPLLLLLRCGLQSPHQLLCLMLIWSHVAAYGNRCHRASIGPSDKVGYNNEKWCLKTTVSACVLLTNTHNGCIRGKLREVAIISLVGTRFAMQGFHTFGGLLLFVHVHTHSAFLLRAAAAAVEVVC